MENKPFPYRVIVLIFVFCVVRKKRKPEDEAGEADSKKPRQGSLTDAQKTDTPSDPKAGGDAATPNGHVNGTTNGDAKKEEVMLRVEIVGFNKKDPAFQLVVR